MPHVTTSPQPWSQRLLQIKWTLHLYRCIESLSYVYFVFCVVPPPRPEHIEVLKNQFGHSEFRPTQWDIIHSILVVCSLCYVGSEH